MTAHQSNLDEKLSFVYYRGLSEWRNAMRLSKYVADVDTPKVEDEFT